MNYVRRNEIARRSGSKLRKYYGPWKLNLVKNTCTFVDNVFLYFLRSLKNYLTSIFVCRKVKRDAGSLGYNADELLVEHHSKTLKVSSDFQILL